MEAVNTGMKHKRIVRVEI